MLTIRLESRDSSCVKSNRLTGSRFARDLEKKKAKRLSTLGRVGNVDDSTRFARFVLREVESTHPKSICERLRKNKAKRLSTLGRVGNVDDSTRFDSNRAIRLA